jgi:hypothetical protein
MEYLLNIKLSATVNRGQVTFTVESGASRLLRTGWSLKLETGWILKSGTGWN